MYANDEKPHLFYTASTVKFHSQTSHILSPNHHRDTHEHGTHKAEKRVVTHGRDGEASAARSVQCTCHRGRRRGRSTWRGQSGSSQPVSCPGWSGPCPRPHASAALQHTHTQTHTQHIMSDSFSVSTRFFFIYQEISLLLILLCPSPLFIHF